jgi:hypothetical protein
MMLGRNTLWKAQALLHGKNNNAILPCALILGASVLLVYCHATESSDAPTKTFLSMIILQMLPLVFLEVKILSCPDPVAMLSQFGAKVLLMHACFLLIRVIAWPFWTIGMPFANLAGLAAACFALRWGFGFQFSALTAYKHRDVWGLMLLAVASAMCMETFWAVSFRFDKWFFEKIVFSCTSYVELLSFVPAVWIVHQTSKKVDDVVSTKGANLEKQALSFFTFLLMFYTMDDLFMAFQMRSDEPLVAAGHLVHFLLLADFACFLLAHIYNPEKLHGQLLRWLPNHQLFV